MDLAWFLLSALGRSAAGKLSSIPDTLIHISLRPWSFLLTPAKCQSIVSPRPDFQSAAEPLGQHAAANDHLHFLRDCVECLLLHQGKPDNQTCHHQCKDEVITWVDSIGECPAELWTAVSLDLGRHPGVFPSLGSEWSRP